ncbi:aldehyde dehydrogenase family protein [Paraburkholderia tuberum]|uniref:Aldehyde dehydrogenase (NAD+) n=1 Tax=Paraburkholderia tuberum TaxID=157910 RepID=A0A1H1KHD7_9BURK|nr:aldehyde dehydrogenase family protein [Paraburkholderia tuberum]SDR61656.1 aldehyde dehydrogenase (NAD+) [Paraburkholderia tuberum]
MSSQRLLHYIAGRSVAPSADAYIPNNNPATGAPIGEVAAGNAADVDLAVKSSHEAYPAWRDLRPMERGRIMISIAQMLRRDIDRFAEMEAADAGKKLQQARSEIEVCAQYFDFYGGLVNYYQGEVINLGAGLHSYTRREPYGVIGAILPWNAPLNQACRAVAPALAVGNAVVSKPSEETSSSLIEFAKMCVEECGLPPGILNVVLGRGHEAGRALVEHPLVRKVSFTGSVRAGREIGHIAAERIIPLTLELGGKSPNIVFDDADLEAAANGVVRGFTWNAGQICWAGTRCLVQRTTYDRFVKLLVAKVNALRVGADAPSDVGAITTDAQYQRVRESLQMAVKDGARLLAGSTAEAPGRIGNYIGPALYESIDPKARIAQEEIFGPVGVVIPFDDEADAIRISNDSEYGLAAGIWTRDIGRALRMVAAVEAGQVTVNDYFAAGIETPFGGYKNSGYGREKGIEALHHNTQLKCVTIRL